jgi:MFS family permease
MKSLGLLSVGNFFATAHFFLIIYILVPYLATLMPAHTAGLAVSFGAIVTLVLFPFMPKLVRTYSPQRVAVVLAVLEAGVLLSLSFYPSALLAVVLASLACAVPPLIVYQLDVLLEATVRNEQETGRIRTIFLTSSNIALLVTPLVIGFLLGYSDNYGRVFSFAALTLLPFILLMGAKKLPHIVLPVYKNVTDACVCVVRDADLRAVAASNATLQFFFHLAPLYIPLYLHTVLGFPWTTLGWMFAVMLIPFVLLEYPAGYLADTKFGDKKLLVLGFIITGISFAAVGLITRETSMPVILLILVGTRIGAALVEAMTESHFFRRVSEEDVNTVGIFRVMRPGGALIAPIVGTLLLSVSSYSVFFAVTGTLVLVAGLASALSIRDPM